MHRRFLILVASMFTAVSVVQPVYANGGLEQARLVVAAWLIDTGRAPEDAHAAAAELTADDLIVLVNNPGMMQQAGAIGAKTWTIILVVLLVGAIVALALTASSSTIMIGG